jgi:hypothetical protein
MPKHFNQIHERYVVSQTAILRPFFEPAILFHETYPEMEFRSILFRRVAINKKSRLHEGSRLDWKVDR